MQNQVTPRLQRNFEGWLQMNLACELRLGSNFLTPPLPVPASLAPSASLAVSLAMSLLPMASRSWPHQYDYALAMPRLTLLLPFELGCCFVLSLLLHVQPAAALQYLCASSRMTLV